MEIIRGRMSHTLNLTELHTRLANYNRVILDLGTGDGRYVHYLADNFPHHFIIGVDSCRENLNEHSRAKLPNMLFIIASAQSLPSELNGLISHITINFPWGSLLDSLLTGDQKLLCGLESIARSTASIDIRLNGGALAETGTTLEHGEKQINANLLQAGWQVETPVIMDSCALRTFPTTWAKRLAFGSDPRALAMSGSFACM